MISKASKRAWLRYCRPQTCVTALHSDCSLAQSSWPRHMNHSCSYGAVPQPSNSATSWDDKTWTIAQRVKSESTWSKFKTCRKISHHSSNVVKPAALFVTQRVRVWGRWTHWFLNTRDKTAIIAAAGGCVCVCVRDMLVWKRKHKHLRSRISAEMAAATLRQR